MDAKREVRSFLEWDPPQPVYTVPKTVPLLFNVDRFYRLSHLKQSEMISARMWNKIFHLDLTALPHYLTKIGTPTLSQSTV